MILSAILGGLGAVALATALFCAYGAGISIEQVGVDTKNKAERRLVVLWFNFALLFAIAGFFLILSAGKNLS